MVIVSHQAVITIESFFTGWQHCKLA